MISNYQPGDIIRRTLASSMHNTKTVVNHFLVIDRDAYDSLARYHVLKLETGMFLYIPLGPHDHNSFVDYNYAKIA